MEWRPFDQKHNPYASSNMEKPPMMTREEHAAWLASFTQPVEPVTPVEPAEPATGPLTEREKEWIAHNIWNGGIEGWIE